MIDSTAPSPETASASPDECYRCGYDLRTLDNASPCPECGLLAERSRRVTDELHDTRPRWLRSLRAGVLCLLLAVILLAALPVAPELIFRAIRAWLGVPAAAGFSGRAYAVISSIASFALPLLAAASYALGVFLLTIPERYPPADRADALSRRLTRLAAFVPLALLLTFQLSLWIWNGATGEFDPLGPDRMRTLILLSGILSLAPQAPLLFERLRTVAFRARSAHLAEHCRIVGIGAALTILDIGLTIFVFQNARDWFGATWFDESSVPMILVGLLLMLTVVFAGWTLYVLVRFAIKFHLAARAADRKWRAADLARAVSPSDT